MLPACLDYHHRWRVHRSLEMDCPEPREVHTIDRGGVIEVVEVGGLHHHYERRRLISRRKCSRIASTPGVTTSEPHRQPLRMGKSSARDASVAVRWRSEGPTSRSWTGPSRVPGAALRDFGTGRAPTPPAHPRRPPGNNSATSATPSPEPPPEATPPADRPSRKPGDDHPRQAPAVPRPRQPQQHQPRGGPEQRPGERRQAWPSSTACSCPCGPSAAAGEGSWSAWRSCCPGQSRGGPGGRPGRAPG